MKLLNLYAWLWWNRTLWEWHEVTAVEINPDIAKVYQDRFPNDKVIVWDAHEYLLEHYKEYDFIWTSPPCQSHSSFRQNIGVRYRWVKAIYPDMMLWQEIIFLQANCKWKYVVENVKPYYKPLIEPTAILQRHYFWANFDIKQIEIEQDKIRTAQIPDLQKLHKIDLSDIKIKDKRQLLRNCVHYKLWEHIINELWKKITS